MERAKKKRRKMKKGSMKAFDEKLKMMRKKGKK